jgi:uncharacterized protein YbaP (TraB family)
MFSSYNWKYLLLNQLNTIAMIWLASCFAPAYAQTLFELKEITKETSAKKYIIGITHVPVHEVARSVVDALSILNSVEVFAVEADRFGNDMVFSKAEVIAEFGTNEQISAELKPMH